MLNFPDSPAVDQVFASGALAWRWDGAKWVAKDQTSLSGMVAGQIPIAASATAIASSANLSGDVSSNAALATTLATVNSNVGTFQGITLNAKGLATAASNQAYLIANQTITLTGDVSGSGTTTIATTLATVPVAKGGTNKTSWVAGSVAFAASASALGEDNANLFFDNTNKRLGIGTTAPAGRLSVNPASNPTTNATARTLLVGENTNAAGNKLAIGYFNDGTWKSAIQSTDSGSGAPLVLNGDGGNVGISTAGPRTTLDVNGPIAVNAVTAQATGTVGGVGFVTGDATHTGYVRWYNPAATVAGGSFTAYMGYDGATAITLNLSAGVNFVVSGGNVGIGTTSPASALSVTGLVSLQVGGMIGFAGATVAPTLALYSLYGDTTSTAVNVRTGGSVQFKVNNVEMARVDSGGNFGIGTTAPNYKMHVKGQSAAGLASIFGLHSGPNGADSTTVLALFGSFAQDVTIGQISRTGTNSVAYQTTSDARLKDAITESNRGLDALMQIKVSDYDMGETHQQGLLAQDVARHYPEAVHEGGEDPATEPWMIDYGRLTPLLIKSIQQLSDKLEAAEAEIATLRVKR